MNEITKNDRGLAVLAGTNRKVFRIIIWWQTGMAAEEMVEDCNLTMGQLAACLRYYDANKEEIDNLIAKDELDYQNWKQAWRDLTEHFRKEKKND